MAALALLQLQYPRNYTMNDSNSNENINTSGRSPISSSNNSPVHSPQPRSPSPYSLGMDPNTNNNFSNTAAPLEESDQSPLPSFFEFVSGIGKMSNSGRPLFEERYTPTSAEKNPFCLPTFPLSQGNNTFLFGRSTTNIYLL